MRTGVRAWTFSVIVVLAHLIASHQASAGQWTNWEWINPLPQGMTLRKACHGGGISLAIGHRGTILLSEDETSWEIVQSGQPYSLVDVTWTGEQFIAVGGSSAGIVLSSADGRDWTERHNGEARKLWSVHWNGSQALAVGEGRIILTSTDGITWTSHELAEELHSPLMRDVAWSGSRYVAVGRDADDLMGLTAAFVSEDGVNWSLIDFGDMEMIGLAGLTWGLGHFVMSVARNDCDPVIWFSEDGLDWTVMPTDVPGYLLDIVFADGRFAATSSAFFATSTDALHWVFSDGPFDDRLNGLAWLEDRYLVVGDNGFMTTTTIDGSGWEQISSRSIDSNSGVIQDMVLGDHGYVGVTSLGRIFSSPDGNEWTKQFSVHDRLFSVRWLENEYWAVGSNGHILQSGTSDAWETRHYDYEISFFDITSNGSLLVAVGWRNWSTGAALIATSHDGHNWTYQEFHDIQGPLKAAVWTGNIFVVTGARGLVFTSSDGVSWATAELGDKINIVSMEWNGERLVAVGGLTHTETQAGGLIATSKDGLVWDQLIIPDAAFDNVTWTGRQFVAVGDGWMFTSANGVGWTQERPGFGSRPISAAGDDAQLFTAGNHGMILRADHVPVVPRRGHLRAKPADYDSP